MRDALTLRQLEVLAAVKGGGSIAEVAKRLKVHRTGVYQVMQRLAAGGFMKLKPPRALTKKGEQALSTAVESLRSTIEHAQSA